MNKKDLSGKSTFFTDTAQVSFHQRSTKYFSLFFCLFGILKKTQQVLIITTKSYGYQITIERPINTVCVKKQRKKCWYKKKKKVIFATSYRGERSYHAYMFSLNTKNAFVFLFVCFFLYVKISPFVAFASRF